MVQAATVLSCRLQLNIKAWRVSLSGETDLPAYNFKLFFIGFIPFVLGPILALSTIQSICKKDESKASESPIGAHHYPVDGRLTESIGPFTNESLELMEEDVKVDVFDFLI